MSELWFHPRDIIFTREQCLWILSWFLSEEIGDWPPEPKGSGYVDAQSGKRSRGCHAPFEAPCQITAEISLRLERTGKDGKILIREVQAGYTLFSDEAWTALNYISGWKRRRTGYSDFRSHKRW